MVRLPQLDDVLAGFLAQRLAGDVVGVRHREEEDEQEEEDTDHDDGAVGQATEHEGAHYCRSFR